MRHGLETFYDNGPSFANAQTDGFVAAFSKSIWHDSFVLQKVRDILDTISDKPFSLTIATIDTHFPAGFYDESCREKTAPLSDRDKLFATVRCSPCETSEFLSWFSRQTFYENALIVGAHLFHREPLSDDANSRQWIDLSIHFAQAAPQKNPKLDFV